MEPSACENQALQDFGNLGGNFKKISQVRFFFSPSFVGILSQMEDFSGDLFYLMIQTCSRPHFQSSQLALNQKGEVQQAPGTDGHGLSWKPDVGWVFAVVPRDDLGLVNGTLRSNSKSGCSCAHQPHPTIAELVSPCFVPLQPSTFGCWQCSMAMVITLRPMTPVMNRSR